MTKTIETAGNFRVIQNSFGGYELEVKQGRFWVGFGSGRCDLGNALAALERVSNPNGVGTETQSYWQRFYRVPSPPEGN